MFLIQNRNFRLFFALKQINQRLLHSSLPGLFGFGLYYRQHMSLFVAVRKCFKELLRFWVFIKQLLKVCRNIYLSWFAVKLEGHLNFITSLDTCLATNVGTYRNHKFTTHNSNSISVSIF